MPSRRLDRLCARATLRPAGLAAIAVLLFLAALPALGLFLYGLDLMLEEMGLACALRRSAEPGFSWWLLPNGTPLFARPYTQALSPLRWLSLAFPLDWAVSAMPILHLALGAASATWLARTFGARSLTAGATGVAFALSGPALNLIHHSPFLAAAPCLPLVWAGARRALHPRGGATAVAAVGFGLLGCLVGAEPQSFALATALVVLEILLRRPWSSRRVLRRGLLLGGCVVASVLGSLAVWAPALAEAALTPRGGALAASDALRRSFTPGSWPSLLIPGAEQPVQPFTTLSNVLEGRTWSLPWDAEAYLGPLMLVAAALAFARRRTASLSVVAVVGALLSVGDTLPLLPALMKLVPPLATFRFPAKYLVITALAITVLGGIGLQQVARSQRRRRAFVLASSAAAALLILAIGLVLTSADALAQSASPAAPPVPFLPTLSSVLSRGLVQALVPLVGALLVARFAPRRVALLPALLALDLAFAAPSSLQVGPPLGRTASPLARIPSSGAMPNHFCIDPELEKGTFFDEETSAWVGSLRFQKTWGLGELPACDGVTTAIPYSALRTRIHYVLESGLRSKSVSAAWVLGCTHVVTAQPWPGLEIVPMVGAPPGATVQRLPAPVTASFVVAAPRLLSEAQVLDAMRSARSLDEVASLVDDPLGRLAGRALPVASGGLGIARLTWPRQDEATLALTGTGGGVVGLKTFYQVGWSARQAGRELPIVRAHGVHLAVVVDDAAAGPVELRYRPPHLAAGVASSVVGVALLCLLSFLGRARPRAVEVRA
ncbi:MAG: hypothetical protein QM765_34395 [Myxococcales bacterium]